MAARAQAAAVSCPYPGGAANAGEPRTAAPRKCNQLVQPFLPLPAPAQVTLPSKLARAAAELDAVEGAVTVGKLAQDLTAAGAGGRLQCGFGVGEQVLWPGTCLVCVGVGCIRCVLLWLHLETLACAGVDAGLAVDSANLVAAYLEEPQPLTGSTTAAALAYGGAPAAAP